MSTTSVTKFESSATLLQVINFEPSSKIYKIETDFKYKNIMSSVASFKTAVTRIRDILRGPGVSITGMDSMRHICLYLLSRYMTRDKVGSLGVPEEFSWDTLINIAQTKNGGVQKALDCFYNKDGDCLVNHFDRLFGTDKFSFDVKSPQKHKEILEVLHDVNMSEVDCQIDILGWVYEQHLGTGSSSASRDLGQYFTDRFICKYMTECCKPGFKRPGVPESVCDPTMGTGGFLTTFIKYFKENHSDTPVDWSVQQKEIHGFDTDPKVAGVARLNLFMEMGGNRSTNLLTHDSLYGDLTQIGYDIILANMPFGLKGITHAECCERVKNLKIRGTKSEPLFLQLMMVSLNLGGRCAVVVPDGMLVNTSSCHNDTRKYLLDNFELKKVIKMSGKFFMNTSIKPTILFFENNGKPTTAVEFWDVVRNEKGELTETMITSVPRAKIDATSSLDMRRYIEDDKLLANPAGFPMVRLGDVCKVSFGERITQKDNTGTIHPVYGSGKETFYTDNHNRIGKTCKIGRFAISEVNMVLIVNGPYWLMDSGFTVESKKPETISTEFLWYCLLMDKKRLATLSTGSCQKNIDMAGFYKVEYSCPPLAIQGEIVATLDRIFQPGTTELADTLKMTEKAMDLVLANQNGATLEPIVEAQRLIRKSAQMVADVKAQMVAIVKSVEARGFPIVKLSEGCAVNKGRRCLIAVDSGGYPYQDVSKVSRMVETYILDTPAVLTPRAMSIGRFVYSEGKCHPSDDMFILKPTEGLNVKYLYYYCILRLTNKFKESLHGIKPTIDYSVFNYTNIVIPPIAFQQSVVARLDTLQSQLTALENLQKQSEDNARFILESYLNSSSESTPAEESKKEIVDDAIDEIIDPGEPVLSEASSVVKLVKRRKPKTTISVKVSE